MQNLSAAHREISASTIGQYRSMATHYRDGTWNHDVSQNIEALLAAIAGAPPYRILDLGCGPGRDLVTFRDLGHEVVGLDGCSEFVAMARAVSGCEVWQQDMLAMTLPPASFDGVFANAVLFHLPSLALPVVLDRLHAALKPGGVLLASNPRGQDEEGCQCRTDFPQKGRSKFPQVRAWVISRRAERGLWVWADGRAGAAAVPAAAA